MQASASVQAPALPLTLETCALQMPARCCNCGRPRDLEPVETAWEHRQSAIYVTIVRNYSFRFPYCEPCAPSAARPAPERSTQMLLAFGVGILTVVAMEVLVGSTLADSDAGLVIGLVAGVVAFGVMAAWTAAQKPLPGQTSYYQPVRLMGFRQKFTGKVTGLKLGFTSSLYEREFREANQLAYQAGLLESRVLPQK
jgi:hypothetical protein